MPASSRESGFTMIELLVSLAIIGMMSLLLVQGLHGGRRVWDRVETRTRAADTVLAAQMRLAEIVSNAVPETSYQGSEPFTRFEGAATGLTLLADPDAAAGSGGVQQLTLALAADGRLVLARRPDLAAHAAVLSPVAPVETPLLAGVERVEFGYFGAAAPDHERRWRPRWVDQATLPELVRLRLAFAYGDPRRWPELIARPAATVDTGCVYVPATGRCKGRA